jgi:tRNA nucleotidyltransferase (CCA-adding enzyme)
MPDYIYLLENRLSPEQQKALRRTTEAARARGMTVFLAGGAVRDFTSGSPVRDLDVSVQGNALKLLKDLEKAGATVMGEHEPSQTLYLKFPGGVRIEVSSTRSERFPKPGKPEYHPANILEDLRRRDFTVNAMALSLNEGSYGLLLDPLNGAADIEARHLRLVSNYGFIEEPSRLVRAARLSARYGWALEEKTQTRYETAKQENYIENMSSFSRGYELEEIAHEEDSQKILKHLDAEGWMKALFPAWTTAKADTKGLDELRDTLGALQVQGVSPDSSAAEMELLTAKIPAKDRQLLKKSLSRKGFAEEWDSLDDDAKALAKVLLSKESAMPSATWKLLTSYKPEAVLWLAMTGKGAALQTKFRNFFTVWPESRQRIPYAMMQEMRIVPELPGYQDLQRALFYELMDNKLQTEEEMRKYLEPHSPPAPPPVITIRRPRAAKKVEPKAPRAKKAPKVVAPVDALAAAPEPITPEIVKGKGKVEPAKAAPAPAKAVAAKLVPAKAVPAKTVPAKPEVKKGAAPAKKAAAPAKKTVAKKPATKAAKKAPAKKASAKKLAAKKSAPKKPAPKKAAAKKPAPKSSKKR